MAKKVVKCSRCGKRMRRMDGWNAVFKNGSAVAFVCPDCLTEWERLEMVVNASILESDSATCGLYPVEAFAGAGE